jgi:hypothetical protein
MEVLEMKVRELVSVGDRVVISNFAGEDKLGVVVRDGGLTVEVQPDALPPGHTLALDAWEIRRVDPNSVSPPPPPPPPAPAPQPPRKNPFRLPLPRETSTRRYSWVRKPKKTPSR